MHKIRVFNSLAQKGLERFPADRYQVGPEVAAADALMLRSHKLHDEHIDQSVIAVARAGAGVNNIPVAEYAQRGVVVFNTPGANANAVKELVAAALLLDSRNIFAAMNYVQSLDEITDSAEMHKLLEANKKRFAGSEITGMTLGVVGLGSIGAIVANMALELGMKVAGFDPVISVESAWRLSSQVQKMDSLQALVGVSDYLTLHLPAIPQTRGLINAEIIGRCKPGMRLLNFARAMKLSSCRRSSTHWTAVSWPPISAIFRIPTCWGERTPCYCRILAPVPVRRKKTAPSWRSTS